MSVRLRNISGEPLILDHRRVDDREVVTEPGEPAADQPADALVVEHQGTARAYPTSLWSVADGPAKKKEQD